MLLMTTFKFIQSAFCGCMQFYFFTQPTIKRFFVRLSVCHGRGIIKKQNEMYFYCHLIIIE